jgi:hypothetical protein
MHIARRVPMEHYYLCKTVRRFLSKINGDGQYDPLRMTEADAQEWTALANSYYCEMARIDAEK